MSEAKAMTVAAELDARLRAQAPEYVGSYDPFADDEVLVCGLENPDECEACS